MIRQRHEGQNFQRRPPHLSAQGFLQSLYAPHQQIQTAISDD
jgi:hypothetical protein